MTEQASSTTQTEMPDTTGTRKEWRQPQLKIATIECTATTGTAGADTASAGS